MFCGNCGKQIADYSRSCPYCGHAVGNYMGGAGNGMPYGSLSGQGIQPMQRKKLDNIFSALIQERTTGVIMEFSLWCTICLVIVLSMAAAIIGHGNIVWILTGIFAIGEAVILAFRLKPLMMLYSAVVFQGLIGFIHMVFFGLVADSGSLSVVLLVLITMGSLGLMVCCFIQFFSTFNIGTVCTIIMISISSLLIIHNICIYSMAGNVLRLWSNRTTLNECAYWPGTISLWMLHIVACMLYAFFFWGCIDSSKPKILNRFGGAGNYYGGMAPSATTATTPAIRCVKGIHAGQIFYLQGQTFTIGSQSGVNLLVQDPYVSRQHCAIRFNTGTGCYEVYDNSSNGVFLLNGGPLQKGVYHSVSSGSIICLGSVAQQFQLM